VIFFVSKQWDKNVHMLENNGFFWKTMGFWENNVFLSNVV